MLLPLDCLAYDVVGGRLLPSWLGAADEPFVATVLECVAGFAGLRVGAADLAAPGNLARVARAARLPVRVAEALWAVERRRWASRVDAPVDPELLRDLVFELAARHSRQEVIDEAARRLGVASEVVVSGLFADRQLRRVLVAPDEPARPADLVARYNLALVQALLARSMEVHASITGDASAIALAAKRDGLLAHFEGEGEITRLTLTGPLAIIHETAKYGRSIARFVPSLVAAPSWSLRARITLGPKSAELELDHGGAIAFASTIPAAPDGRLARRVARALRSAGVRVDLHPAVVRAGSSLVVPDFALEWSEGRVLVDVVPFATPDYLACKLEAMARIDEPMLVCIDERFVFTEAPSLVPYRGEIDAFTLYAAALRAVEARVTPLRASPSSGATSSRERRASELRPSSAPLPSSASSSSASSSSGSPSSGSSSSGSPSSGSPSSGSPSSGSPSSSA
jgi:predicted nuclease of restriction endonuclease-like RecB superfamily